jgi:hypothetical protein
VNFHDVGGIECRMFLFGARQLPEILRKHLCNVLVTDALRICWKTSG